MAVVYFNVSKMNTLIKNLLNNQFFIVLLACGLFASCGNGTKDSEKDDLIEVSDTVKTAVLNIEGELFSVPSPVQTAIIIQKSGIPYNKAVLNDKNNVNQYTSEFSRALNLGVYGADLGYVALYNQTQDALGYLSSIKQLSDKLGISAAFDESTMNRFKNNITNKDSMMSLVGLAFRNSDAYLKENKRSNVSSLVVVGGWIEGMYFSVNAYKEKRNETIKNRIASQKQSVNSLIKILSSNASEEGAALLLKFSELADTYSRVGEKYIYEKPETDTLKKMTYLNSKTEVFVSSEQMQAIIREIEELRALLVTVKKS